MKMITTKYEIFSERLPDEFDGLTIAHVSDLHNCDMGTVLISALAEIGPDIIAITGDMIHIEGQSAAAEKFAMGAVQIAPTYYVPGNHEQVLACYGEFKDFLRDTGVHVLENTYETVTRGEKKIALLGMNDPTFFAGKKPEFVAKLTRTCAEIEDAGINYTVLLSHRPELFEQYVAAGIDLSLCGHTHGGHVRVPLIGAIYAPGQGLFPKYSDGRYESDGKCMIISKGLGKSSWVPRIFNPPELVVEKLRCKKCDCGGQTKDGEEQACDDNSSGPISNTQETNMNNENQTETICPDNADEGRGDIVVAEQIDENHNGETEA